MPETLLQVQIKLGEEGKGKGPLAYISCKEISHAPPTSLSKVIQTPKGKYKFQTQNVTSDEQIIISLEREPAKTI